MRFRSSLPILVALGLLAACGGSAPPQTQPGTRTSPVETVVPTQQVASATGPCTSDRAYEAVGRLFALLSAGDGGGAYALFAAGGEGLEIVGYKALGLDDAARHARSIGQFELVAAQLKGVTLELKPSSSAPVAGEGGLTGSGLAWTATGHHLAQRIEVLAGTGKAGLRCEDGKLTRVLLNAG